MRRRAGPRVPGDFPIQNVSASAGVGVYMSKNGQSAVLTPEYSALFSVRSGFMSIESVALSSPNCPTCGKIMSLTGYSPTCESIIYDYQCKNDGDRISWRPRRSKQSFGGFAEQVP